MRLHRSSRHKIAFPQRNYRYNHSPSCRLRKVKKHLKFFYFSKRLIYYEIFNFPVNRQSTKFFFLYLNKYKEYSFIIGRLKKGVHRPLLSGEKSETYSLLTTSQFLMETESYRNSIETCVIVENSI